jgi:hypothetical protein
MAAEPVAHGTRRDEARLVEDKDQNLKASHLVRPVGASEVADVAVLPETPSVWDARPDDQPEVLNREVADPNLKPPTRGQ